MQELVEKMILSREQCSVCSMPWLSDATIYEGFLKYYHNRHATTVQRILECSLYKVKQNGRMSSVLLLGPIFRNGREYFQCPYCETMWVADFSEAVLGDVEKAWVLSSLEQRLHKTIEQY